MKLFLANCIDAMKSLPENSVDAVVTDSPYGLSFMGKHWDYDVPTEEIWREALRVLKPGGHLLSFGGTRTYHRMVVNIEDAGFEIRDQIQWIYGSGFPKSLDVSKAIDKAAGATREKGPIDPARAGRLVNQSGNYETEAGWSAGNRTITIDPPSTDLAKTWQGWGTALKPANEPIVLARKPLEKGLTVAENVLKWGTGAINIDGSRIGTDVVKSVLHKGDLMRAMKGGESHSNPSYSENVGRWPANILFDEEAASMLGEPSRFFYVAKASKSERNAGLDGEIKEKQGARPKSADASGKFPDHDHRPSGGNNHPTVKPIKLMQYLIKLVTPPNGTVLDPFMGSGSTGVAAKNLGFDFIGCEMNEEYFKIAKKRIGV